MSNVAPIRRQPADSESVAERKAAAIRELLDPLSAEERDAVLQRLTELLRPIPAPRAGQVLGTIVHLLSVRPEWTVDALKGEVQRRGVEAGPREVYNALGYLTRRGHIRRVGYGRYIVDGALLVTADDLGGETTRNEDLYREPRGHGDQTDK